MTVAVCVDDDMGLLFNRRRQSRDGALRLRLLSRAEGGLWMNRYSAKQFEDAEPGVIHVDEGFMDAAGEGSICFAEEDIAPWAVRIDRLILYRWNRRYPADVRLTLDLSGWRLVETADFAGSSHERITEEVYAR